MPDTGVPSELVAENDTCDYAFVGNITEAIFLPFLSLLQIIHHYSTQIILTDDANIHHNPYITASGITDHFDSNNLTFTLMPTQYINLPHTVLDCPLLCFFDSNSKKWKSKKPLPTTGSPISKSITGMLMKIKCDINRKPTFEIELDNIVYLSRLPGASSSRLHHMDPFPPPTSHTLI